ncbi:MAG: phosphonoacetate hydrolase, partial [Desulfuromonadales bacterium]|nr:phosphonoacetate hydrolase [Desulfuromonadales bacterium]NIS40154.1 phosphonoacetate hydrolase [Desulfuromonadales bacterium]
MNRISPITVEANGRAYPFPKVPAIAICLDGCEPAYLDDAIAAGLMPALEAVKRKGTSRL